MTGYPYDPEKAKELLAAAGVKPGLKVELLTYNTPRGYNPAGPDLAVAFQGYFQKVGIEAEVRKLDIGAFLARCGRANIRACSCRASAATMAIRTISSTRCSTQAHAGRRYGALPEPGGRKMMEEAARVPDPDKRLAMYKTMQRQIIDDAPWVFVNSVLQVRAARKEVKGFGLNPTQMFFDMDQVSVGK